MLSKLFGEACLVFGIVLTVAAAPEITDKDKACRQATQVGLMGELQCNSNLSCDTELQTCQEVAYRKTVSGPVVKYCACDDDGKGDDPEEAGFCHAYVVSDAQGHYSPHCLTVGCSSDETCDWTDPDLYYKTCSCK